MREDRHREGGSEHRRETKHRGGMLSTERSMDTEEGARWSTEEGGEAQRKEDEHRGGVEHTGGRWSTEEGSQVQRREAEHRGGRPSTEEGVVA